jgi:hypothetical protein
MSLVLAKKGCKLVIWDINTDAAQKVGTFALRALTSVLLCIAC